MVKNSVNLFQWSLIYHCLMFYLSILRLDFKSAKNKLHLLVLKWALEDVIGFWLGLVSWLWFVFSHWTFLGPFVYFAGSKNIHVLWVLICDFGCGSRFMTGVWHHDLDFDMVPGLWYIYDPNLCSLSWFWRGKGHPCPLSPNLELWRMLEIPDWGLASWSWLEFGHWSLLHPWSKFWFSMWISKVQRTSMSWKSWFGALEDAGGSWLGFGIMILIFIWSVVFDTHMIQIVALYLDLKM